MSNLRLSEDVRSQHWLHGHVSHVLQAILILIVLTLFGVLGYQIIEGWSFLDSLFMTVITLSTVGYGEVQPLSQNGVIFSIFLIMGGVLVAIYAFGVIGSSAIEGQLNRFRKIYRMNKMIDKMENHYIITAFNTLTDCIIPDLINVQKQLVVIESDHDAIEELANHNIPYIEGNASDDIILKKAGIMKASALLAVSDNDSENVFVTLSARNLNNKLHIVSRTDKKSSEAKLRLAGANSVISPFRVSGARIVQQLIHPYINDFLEIATDNHGTQLVLEQFIIPKNSEIAGKSIIDSGIRDKTGAMVAANIKNDGTMVLSPGRDSIIEAGSTLIVFGTREGLEKLSNLVDLANAS